jgi:pilus assembly protein CpaF
VNPFEGTRRRQGRKLDSLLLETVRESVLAGNGPVTPSTVAAAVQASGRLLGTAGALEAAESINAELNGLGPLQQLAQDPAVTDIFVNGPHSVWGKDWRSHPCISILSNRSGHWHPGWYRPVGVDWTMGPLA